MSPIEAHKTNFSFSHLPQIKSALFFRLADADDIQGGEVGEQMQEFKVFQFCFSFYLRESQEVKTF